MAIEQAEFEAGLAAFGSLLLAEYNQDIAPWARADPWGDRERLQISRAIGLLIKEPIADVRLCSQEEMQASETSAQRRWDYSDAKITTADWEGSWQWRLLADIDNASGAGTGQMMTPSDPRLFILRIRYERDLFAVLSGHLLEFLCGRPIAAKIQNEILGSDVAGGLQRGAEIVDLLRQTIPGFDAASSTFMAGLAFLISRIGIKTFCDWCDERSTAQNDGAW